MAVKPHVMWNLILKLKYKDKKEINMTNAVYNTIGKTYDNTRKADPEIAKTIAKLLQYKPNGFYLDIGCGSGNYTGALAEIGLKIEGIDLSTEMLEKAKKKYSQINFHQGDATALPFSNNKFDGAICILATHHIHNNKKLFQEAFRVINKGRFVIFTATPQQINHYWTGHYFPEMMESDKKKMTSFDEIKTDLGQAGFVDIQRSAFYVTNQLQDWFLAAGKYRPEIYLDPVVRHGISSFHLSSNPVELKNGLKQLEKDIQSGKINEIIQNYESDIGEYMFIIGEK